MSLQLLSLALVLCSLPPVLAQVNATQVEIEAIEAHFNQSGLVPAPLAPFTPGALLSVAFEGIGKTVIGQPIVREQALYEPDLSMTAFNPSIPLRGTSYTIIMVDAGPPGSDQSHGVRRHWLVNGATVLDGAASTNISTVGATVVTQYIPPNPPVGDGPHRYAILVLAQPADFVSPPDLSQPNVGGGRFSVGDYTRYTKCVMVAASYFTCQRGPATASIPPTSAVISQTLPGWSSTTIHPTGAGAQKTNSGPSTTHNALALFLAPIMGLLAL